MRRGLVDAAIVALFFHGALPRSEVAARAGRISSLPSSSSSPAAQRRNPAGDRRDVRRLVGACAARDPLPASGNGTETQRSRRPSRRRVDKVNRRFAAACAAVEIEGRRTSQGGPVGLPSSSPPGGAAIHTVQLAGGREDASMLVLCRFARHPRRRRQPIYAMKGPASGLRDRNALRPPRPSAPTDGVRFRLSQLFIEPAEDPPAGSDLTPESGQSAPVSRRRYYSGGDVRSAEVSGEEAGLTARGRRIRSGGSVRGAGWPASLTARGARLLAD